MSKVLLMALVAAPLTFASAHAFDNVGPGRAAAAFGEFGVQGLAVAGQGRSDEVVPLTGPYEATSVPAPANAPVCWTRYVTVANGNTLVNAPVTVCR